MGNPVIAFLPPRGVFRTVLRGHIFLKGPYFKNRHGFKVPYAYLGSGVYEHIIGANFVNNEDFSSLWMFFVGCCRFPNIVQYMLLTGLDKCGKQTKI